MKKIAIVTPGLLPVPAVNGGGVENLIQTLIDQNENNHILDIDLYTLYSDKYSLNKYKYTKFYLIRLYKFIEIIYNFFNKISFKFFKVFLFSYFGCKVKRIIKNHNYDVVIVENGMTIFYKIYKFCNSKKIMYHLHNDFVNDNDKNFNRLLRICNNSSNVIVVSKFLKDKILSKTDKINNVVVLNNVIDLKKFNYKNINYNKVSKLRKKFLINENDFVFLYSGRIVQEKGVLEIIHAFNNSINEYKNIKLILCGLSNDLKTNYEKEVYNSIKDNKNIINVGLINNVEMPLFYSLSNCVILITKIEEAFGLSALEALAMKRILLYTNSGELPNLVKDYGIMINKNNIEVEIVNAMKYILNNKKESEKKAKLGYNYVHNNSQFNEDFYLKNFVNIIDM